MLELSAENIVGGVAVSPRTFRGFSSFTGVNFTPLFLPGGVVMTFSALLPGSSDLSYAVARSRVIRAEDLIARYLERHGIFVTYNEEPMAVSNDDGSSSVELLVAYEPGMDLNNRVFPLRHCERILRVASIVAL